LPIAFVTIAPIFSVSRLNKPDDPRSPQPQTGAAAVLGDERRAGSLRARWMGCGNGDDGPFDAA
jgi:hypothetical protein